MPGIPTNTATPVKKQDNMASTPALEKGRRKLDEFRKKRADQKNKASLKTNTNDVQSEGLANGPDIAPIIEGNDREVDFNGLDAQTSSVLKEKRKEVVFQALRSEQVTSGDAQYAKGDSKDFVQEAYSVSGYMPTPDIIQSQQEGDSIVQGSEEDSRSTVLTRKVSHQDFSILARRGHEHSSWMKGPREVENMVSSKLPGNFFPEHAFEENNDPPMFHHKESATGKFSDGPLPSRAVGNSWKQPVESLRQGFLHESFSTLEQNTGRASSIVHSLPSTKDGTASSMPEERHQQHRSSWLPNGRRSWDPRQTKFSFTQPNKMPYLDRAEREPHFQSGLLDKHVPSFSTVAVASPASSSSTDHQDGISLPLLLPDQPTIDVSSDKDKDLKSQKQPEGKQQHAKNDDFASLEQHIDDLTQEKFGLQRVLDAARSLADSLSQQNSSLTEDFNSQGAIINQLQEELEKKKEEVTAQSLVLSSLMMERERAQQENNSAVERSQILAGEVIGLEEKVLRLRSSELKLQKELENLKAENDSLRVQVATLDKDRKNLQTMFDALQEDKKMLQNQLQKASTVKDRNAAANAQEITKRTSRDASTSTEDSGLHTLNSATVLPVEKTEDKALTASSVVSLQSSSGVGLPSMFATLSSDDYRAIDGIDKLITELFSEKEALVDLLQRESARAVEFERANYELTKKLESQTQRLELAVAQNMAFGGNAVTAMNTTEIEPQYNDYVDEGDEVVERVLGWIMQIFPGGSSRRRSSKRL